MRVFTNLLLLTLSFLLISGCSTQKKRGQYSPIGQAWHDLNARFNGYFNATELYDASEELLRAQHQHNYNELLPIYTYVAADNPKAAAPDLDIAIEKSSIVVSIHRGSKWTDDCYLLIGKAQYLKKDYETAEETFKYLANEYNPKAIAKRNKEIRSAKAKKAKRKKIRKQKRKQKKKRIKKKRKQRKKQIKQRRKARRKGKGKRSKIDKKRVKKEKKEDEIPPDDGGFMNHPPAYRYGLFWLARTYIERDNYSGAEAILEELSNNPATPQDLKPEISIAKARIHIKQKDYKGAIAPLKVGIEDTKRKDDRARYAFILAQLYQMDEQSDQAYAYYKLAKKYSTSYEMNFNARLKMEQNSWLANEESAENVIAKLEKMLKDPKNEEYRDQIYFSMAQVALQQNDKVAAVDYLKKSLQYNTKNQAQKTESYYTLANLFFEGEDFVNAKNYMDSTLQVMAETDERYDEVSRLNASLTDIAKNIQIIQEQDSLLTLASLSKDELEKRAKEIKKELEKAEKARERAATNAKFNSQQAGNQSLNPTRTRRIPGSPQPSNFPFYNDRKRQSGIRDFERKWGDRALDDDWRRSNRRGAKDKEDTAIDSLTVAENEEFSEDLIEEIFGNIPFEESEKVDVNKSIEDALFELGVLYRDRLFYDEKCIETLEELLRRYPDTEHELDAMYYLYLAHTNLNQTSEAKGYFNKICDKYPQSVYCKVLTDPTFAQQQLNKEELLKKFYEDTYDLYRQSNYKIAYENAVKAPEKFGADNPLQPKFALLAALCTGNLQGKDQYVKSLKNVVAKYPETPEETRAKEILRLIEGVTDKNQEEGDDGPFKIEDEKIHYALVVINDQNIKLTDAKIEVSNYHRKYHKLDKLKISNIFLGQNSDTPILVIRRFKGKAEAMDYYTGIKKNKEEYLKVTSKYQYFVINQYNYRQVIKLKSIDDYVSFFNRRYLEDF